VELSQNLKSFSSDQYAAISSGQPETYADLPQPSEEQDKAIGKQLSTAVTKQSSLLKQLRISDFGLIASTKRMNSASWNIVQLGNKPSNPLSVSPSPRKSLSLNQRFKCVLA
jgi:hypothetical protein